MNNNEILQKRILSMLASAKVLKADCIEGRDDAILSNMNGRIWAFQQVLSAMNDEAIRQQR